MNKKIVRQVCLAVLFPLFMLMPSHPTRAQEANVTIDMRETPMKKVMTEIERQTSYLFGVASEVNIERPVTVKVQNAPVRQALDQMTARYGDIAYEISGANIFLRHITPKQPKTIKGTVIGQDGQPIPGVSVYVKGHTSAGTVSDLDGNFTLEVPANLVSGELEYNSLGYDTVTMPIEGTGSFDVTLKESSVALEGTVVTALGIRREEKALSYNVQEIKSEEITAIKDANFINSLNGKVAGVNINGSSSGVGGASRVIMRGMKSIEQSSNALYVIDGIPMYNFRREGDTQSLAFDSRGSSESIADLNPDDIESISVLTGAAAAALYGSNAANGAIVITTKKGQVGKLQVSVNSSTELSAPFLLPDFQNRYGTGRNGVSSGSGVLSWGAKLNEASRTGYHPSQFFDTGLLFSNSVTLSTGTERNQTFFSAAAVNSQGMVPNNAYNRFNFTFRNTTSFLQDKMHLDLGASYIIQNDRNMTSQGWYSNPLVPVYLFPRGDDFGLVRYFERYDAARKINTQYWPQGEGDFSMQNPYWVAYRNPRTNRKSRYMLSGSLSYDITDWLNVTGRVRVDNSTSVFEQKLYASTITTLTEGSSQGFYAIEKPEERQTYADVLVNVDKKFGDFSLVANLGASIVDNHYQDLSYRGPIRENGIPNVFNVWDLDSNKKRARQTGWREQTQSVFASVELGWKSMLYLTVTGRNDWASQLANSSTTSFFYPSAGLSAIISEMAEMPEWIDLLKVRGSFSSVGTPYPRNLTSPTFEYDETTQGWKPKTHYCI